ncbi:DsrE family protein [Alloalcanivorax profundimaris]|uniref:DsrE/DsrF family oxidoreductase family protein n=1 Tax=Alloalcanivorax profundimaris TaxID=2735259 RepID=A0ABS0AR48_9GAMM|nr:DsrE family protein [Alloalcanivorax profundimaris]MBF1802199.1 DsrE family protein [Alloalcanivorax profundimaris]MBF5056475.1 DsrE/DsrF family oxidoreductase family protein [Alloalcanivorax profundimaris]MCQ6261039.1 DsrE family protein [Alcanivorax sp. MM125-6]
MSQYLFIQSQDPFTESRTRHQFDLIGQLHEAGHDVSVLLVQNGVTPARRGARTGSFDRLLDWGVPVLADTFSLEQREIDDADLKDNIGLSSLHVVIDAMLANGKVIWH